MQRQPRVRVGRVYDARTAEDGTRVLVDRLWPRGLTKDRADLDEWCKQIAPSAALRRGTATTRTASPSSRAATGANSTIPDEPGTASTSASWRGSGR